MIEQLFIFFGQFDDYLWGYVAPPLILIFGVYLTFKSGFFQVRKFPAVLRHFWQLLRTKRGDTRGVHPLRAFFASVGGCVGIGNIVLACTAVQIGGPGALFWIWVTAFFGMMIKYAEVYLGVKYREKHGDTYTGGVFYFLQRVFKTPWIPRIVCLLLCIYGVEVLQFNIVTNSLTQNYGLNPFLFIGVFLVMVLYAGAGGVRRVGSLCTAIIPVFTVLFVGMGLWVLWENLSVIPSAIQLVVSSAFTGHAAIGGFAGSTFLMAMSQGVRRGCYSGDIGVGYASVIHSETASESPSRQASLTLIEIFLDTFVTVTVSIMVILVTDIWHEPIHESLLVQTAMSSYFPMIHYFMPFFILLLGYSTIIAYFCFGIKASEYLSPKYGRRMYFVYATAAFVIFSFLPTHHALILQSVAGALLLVFNVWGMLRLRREIEFDL